MSPLPHLPLAHAHFGNLTGFEWVLVGIAGLVGAWSIWKAVAYTLRPGEDDPGHVKRLILDAPGRRPEGRA